MFFVITNSANAQVHPDLGGGGLSIKQIIMKSFKKFSLKWLLSVALLFLFSCQGNSQQNKNTGNVSDSDSVKKKIVNTIFFLPIDLPNLRIRCARFLGDLFKMDGL